MSTRTNEPEKAVYRQLALPVSVFDWIKTVQRDHTARHGEHLSINQTVSRIVREHQQHNVEREGRTHDQERKQHIRAR